MTITKATEILNAPDYPSRRLRDRERKVVEVAEQYAPGVTADWATTPTTISNALDQLAAGGVEHLEVTGTITSSEILALNATPKELIAAPGAGKAIIVDEIELFLSFGTTAYVAGVGEDLTIEYSAGVDIATWDNDTDDILVGIADERRINRPTVYDVVDATTIDNEAVNASIAVGEVLTGDSDIKYRITYKVVTLLV
jgi:hypothetical protein